MPVQGMSHYLEHMLFMGSEGFPDENDYDAYLQRHGGSANAFTEMVRTAPGRNPRTLPGRTHTTQHLPLGCGQATESMMGEALRSDR